MIGDGFAVWSFFVSLLASSSITKSVPEPYYASHLTRYPDEKVKQHNLSLLVAAIIKI
jgi:hypothetical protein